MTNVVVLIEKVNGGWQTVDGFPRSWEPSAVHLLPSTDKPTGSTRSRSSRVCQRTKQNCLFQFLLTFQDGLILRCFLLLPEKRWKDHRYLFFVISVFFTKDFHHVIFFPANCFQYISCQNKGKE